MKTMENTIPQSEIVFPSSSLQGWLKYGFWRVYTPLHPTVRDVSLALGIVAHSGRQNFLIGRIAPGQTIKSVVDFMISEGYGNHFIAWKDDDEVVSLRKVVDFTYQYHVRIFADGEIRGHYEYTPECYPVLHFKAIGQRDCREEFHALLKERIIPVIQ